MSNRLLPIAALVIMGGLSVAAIATSELVAQSSDNVPVPSTQAPTVHVADNFNNADGQGS